MEMPFLSRENVTATTLKNMPSKQGILRRTRDSDQIPDNITADDIVFVDDQAYCLAGRLLME